MTKSDLIIQREGRASLAYADGICPIKSQSGKPGLSKAFQSVTAGTVEVHLNKDFDAAGANVYTLLHVEATALVSGALDCSGTGEVSAVFDEIRESGTTVPLASLTVWI